MNSALTTLFFVLTAAAIICALVDLLFSRSASGTSGGRLAHLYVGIASAVAILVVSLFQGDGRGILISVGLGMCFAAMISRARSRAAKLVVSDEPRLPVVAPDSAEIKLPPPSELEAQRLRR